MMNLIEATAQDTTYFDGYYVVDLSIDEVMTFENLDGIPMIGSLPDDSYRVFRVYLEVPTDFTQLSSFYHAGVVYTTGWMPCSCPNIFCTEGDMHQSSVSWDYGWQCPSSIFCDDGSWFTDTWLSINGSDELAFGSGIGWSVSNGNYEIDDNGGAIYNLIPLDVSEIDNLWIGNLVCNEEFTFCLGAQFFHTEEGGINNTDRLVSFTVGCMETTACNFNPNATTNAFCEFPDVLDCANNCVNDSDGDGVCDELEIVGCIYPGACNYDVNATDPSGECVFPFTNCQTCSGANDGTGFILENDSDSDGVCDADEILGCTDISACNYSPLATDNENCLYTDSDEDGVCDENEIYGCTVLSACNFNAVATEDDDSCVFPIPGFGCEGEVLCQGIDEIEASSNQITLGDSVILTIPAVSNGVVYSFQLDASPGFQQTIPPLSPNNNFALRVSGTYSYASTTSSWTHLADAAYRDANDPNNLWGAPYVGNAWHFDEEFIRPSPDIFQSDHNYFYEISDWSSPQVIEFVGFGYNNNLQVEHYGFLNFDVFTEDEISVSWSTGESTPEVTLWPTESLEISAIINHGGVQCIATTFIEVGYEGCPDPNACNFDVDALIQTPSLCVYPVDEYTCDGICICDSDNDGVCDGLEVEGCADENACNYSVDVTEHTPGFCIYPEANVDCNGNCLADVDQDGICDEDEVIGCGEPAACNYLGTTTEHIDELCVYAEAFYNCEGECLADEDNDGVCDQLEEAECENLAIDSIWTNLESGVYPIVNEIQLGIETELSFAFSLAAISTDLESGQSFSNISFEVDSIENRPNWLSCDVAGLIINPEEPICLGCAALALDTGVFDLALSGNLTVSVLGSPFEFGEYSFPFQIIVQENNDPIIGCDYTMALNYLPVATVGDGSCIFEGCMDPLASNFNALANTEGDCEYFVSDSCPKDLDGDGLVGVSDLLSLLSDYGAVCE